MSQEIINYLVSLAEEVEAYKFFADPTYDQSKPNSPQAGGHRTINVNRVRDVSKMKRGQQIKVTMGKSGSPLAYQ
jgi:sRNA-binding protein